MFLHQAACISPLSSELFQITDYNILKNYKLNS